MAATAVADDTRAPRTRHPRRRSHAGNVAAVAGVAAEAVRDDDDDDMDGNSVVAAAAADVVGSPPPLTVTRTTWTRMWPPAWAALVMAAAVATVVVRVCCPPGVRCRCCYVSDDCCCCGRCRCRQLERRCRRSGYQRHCRGRVCCATTIARECLQERKRENEIRKSEHEMRCCTNCWQLGQANKTKNKTQIRATVGQIADL